MIKHFLESRLFQLSFSIAGGIVLGHGLTGEIFSLILGSIILLFVFFLIEILPILTNSSLTKLLTGLREKGKSNSPRAITCEVTPLKPKGVLPCSPKRPVSSKTFKNDKSWDDYVNEEMNKEAKL